jgi:hypothetical protein
MFSCCIYLPKAGFSLTVRASLESSCNWYKSSTGVLLFCAKAFKTSISPEFESASKISCGVFGLEATAA